MLYRHLAFDDLIGHPDVTYIPASRVPEKTIVLDGLTLSDTPDDLIILKDAQTTDRGGVIWRDCYLAEAIHYFPPDWRTASWLLGQYSNESNTIDIDPNFLQIEESIETPVLFTDFLVGHRNFGHFVHDTLPYGLLYRRIRKLIPELRPLLGPLNFANQHDLISVVFGLDYKDAFKSASATKIKTLFLPRRQSYLLSDNWRMSFPAVRYIRDVANQTWSSPRSDGNKTPAGLLDVYLHRINDELQPSDSSALAGRNFINFGELSNVLMKLGFIVFEPGCLPIDTISTLISNARRIVAIHGAGLANLIFAPPNTQVLELCSAGGNWRSLEALAAVLGHRFSSMRAPMPQGQDLPALDIPAICRALES